MEIYLKLVKSKRGEEAFRTSASYNNLGGSIIVLRIGDDPNQGEFIHRFKAEISRIEDIYK